MWWNGHIDSPERVGKGHDGIAHELQLVLKVSVVLRQLLLGRARSRVVLVVRRQRTVWVAALEVVFPEFYFQRKQEQRARRYVNKHSRDIAGLRPMTRRRAFCVVLRGLPLNRIGATSTNRGRRRRRDSPTNQGFRRLFSTDKLRKYSSNPCTGFACGCTESVPSTFLR